ncbi:MAG: O-acetylhomoserine aminocarboxypropyltransferase/cysteine synthase [Coriobacteriales bacterium]|nr:O-acetylhomoserine aminocarboxypropyltransferase/cysteine synthase [Coriobacteriales bacterium]MBQ6586118.1 O-acetylhomoserine aminocarboxypropyltransferase/cysteine synthase [Coriobacteriales bacterium]
MSESIGTTCVQGGYRPSDGEPRQLPIYQSTTWKYDTSEHMGRLFDLEEAGYFYTRLQNPTNDAVAAKICALEGGSAAMLTSSGQAANFFALFNIMSAGDHVVASSAIYGGTFNLIKHTMGRMGIQSTFVSPHATREELDAAFQENTKCVFGETVANPALDVLDIETFAAAAHAHGVPLIVDNTFPTPVKCRPFEWGADIVTHSTTKYMDGHGAAVGGAIVDSGHFDWLAPGVAERFPGLTTPDVSYHGVVYAEKFGLGGAFITKCTAQLMRDFGSIQSPQNAFLLNMGLESLHLRMDRHCANGLEIATWLAAHPKVSWVRHPSLPGDANYQLACKYLPQGSCGVVSFGVAGGRSAAEEFMKHLRVAAIETHVADARSCILHPANATHRQMNDQELADCGITPDLVRLSCGIEDASDLIADLDQALSFV